MLDNGYRGMNIDRSLVLVLSNEDNYKRRKNWENCKIYIEVIYDFWEKGYSKTSDLVMVIIGQMIMFLSLMWILKLLSNPHF